MRDRPSQTSLSTEAGQGCPVCPAPLQFQVTYSVNSQESTFNLPGFADLSAVRYNGCPLPRR